MKQWLKMMIDTIKVFILFTGCTILFYYGIIWVNEEYQNYHRYDEPNGTAIKVASMAKNNGTSFLERLKFFYQYGE